MDWYENWFNSPYYKILYHKRDEQEAQQFIESLLHLLRPAQGCKMLDIACGEGRHARQLAEHGFDVTGIDISNFSIDQAKLSEPDNLHFYVQDMRHPFFINYFDFAFNFFTSFGYFRHQRDHQLAANSFAASLKPGGTLVIDFLNFEYVKKQLVAEETISFEGLTFKLHRKLEQNHIIKHISFLDHSGTQRHFTEKVAIFTVSNFENMFREAGMSLLVRVEATSPSR